jgi:hypothetical protein
MFRVSKIKFSWKENFESLEALKYICPLWGYWIAIALAPTLSSLYSITYSFDRSVHFFYPRYDSSSSSETMVPVSQTTRNCMLESEKLNLEKHFESNESIFRKLRTFSNIFRYGRNIELPVQSQEAYTSNVITFTEDWRIFFFAGSICCLMVRSLIVYFIHCLESKNFIIFRRSIWSTWTRYKEAIWWALG